jgi:DNA polymerase-4
MSLAARGFGRGGLGANRMARVLCRECCELTEDIGDACAACGSPRIVRHAELESLPIAHIDCDAFYASVEKRDRPELADDPVIVGHPGGRGVVTTACYVARRYGVRSAMPMFQALERCPHAVVIPPDMGKYKEVSAAIREIFHSVTDIVEPLSLDEAYLDLTERSMPDQPAVLALAGIAHRVESEVGLTVSIGLSHNKFLSKLASELQKPRGLSVIGRAEAKSFLAPLSVRKINGVGEATARRMEDRGIRLIADLQARTEAELTAQFGRVGRRLAQFAHGEDDRVVTPWRPTKSISAETTFRHDTGNRSDLCEVARGLCDRLAAQLTRKGLAGTTIVLKLKTSDFTILTRNKRLPNPTQRADVIYGQAESLIQREADGRTFRLLGVGMSGLGPASEADPPSLFDAL